MFEIILAAMLVSCLCAHFVGVFGECVAIASVGVVRNRPIFDSGNLVKLDVQIL